MGAGDIQRHVGSTRGGFSGMFHVLNRGKRSIAIDLQSERGRDVVRRLARGADAVLQNFRPGVAERLGVGYDQLVLENPRLVYLSISGFGPDGPNAGRRAYDPIIQAYAGVAWVQGRARNRPQQVSQLLLDKLTAATGCQAVTAALFSRERTGKGQHITLSMLDTAIAFLWCDTASDHVLLGDGVDHRAAVGAAGHLAEYADGWGCTMTLSDPEFRGFCRAFGQPELIEDSRFSTLDARIKHRSEWVEILQTRIADAAREMDLATAEERMAAEGVPFGRVHSLDDLPDDPQVRANRIFVESEHPVAGRLREARPAPVFSGTPVAPGGPAPRVGEHTREILVEAGYADEIDTLFEDGVVG
jgi:crotonobetainyl-CoA:carnitine CoA-transferase CaiB-like acyl-CoA transferase